MSNELNYQAIERTDPWAGTAVSQGAVAGKVVVVGSGTKADARVGTAISQGAGVGAGAREEVGAEARIGTTVSQGAEAGAVAVEEQDQEREQQ